MSFGTGYAVHPTDAMKGMQIYIHCDLKSVSVWSLPFSVNLCVKRFVLYVDFEWQDFPEFVSTTLSFNDFGYSSIHYVSLLSIHVPYILSSYLNSLNMKKIWSHIFLTLAFMYIFLYITSCLIKICFIFLYTNSTKSCHRYLQLFLSNATITCWIMTYPSSKLSPSQISVGRELNLFCSILWMRIWYTNSCRIMHAHACKISSILCSLLLQYSTSESKFAALTYILKAVLF